MVAANWFKTSAMAAVVALGSVGWTSAAPAASFSFGITSGQHGYHYDDDYYYEEDYCLTKKQIKRGLRGAGYRNIELIRDRGDVLVYFASKGKNYFKLRVDGCDGDLLRRTKVRRY